MDGNAPTPDEPDPSVEAARKLVEEAHAMPQGKEADAAQAEIEEARDNLPVEEEPKQPSAQ